jgi:hypothetical protein
MVQTPRPVYGDIALVPAQSGCALCMHREVKKANLEGRLLLTHRSSRRYRTIIEQTVKNRAVIANIA